MTERMRRVNESVREVVAETVAGFSDPGLALITVTEVTVSSDLTEARVYYSVFGGKKKRARAIEALNSRRAVVQSSLARQLSMKRTPHLTFEYDQLLEEGVRLTKLIDEHAPATPSDDEPEHSEAD